MRSPWIRNRPTPEEERHAAGAGLAAGLAVGTVVGLGVWYLARILVPRERIEPAELERATGRAVQRRDGEGEER